MSLYRFLIFVSFIRILHFSSHPCPNKRDKRENIFETAKNVVSCNMAASRNEAVENLSDFFTPSQDESFENEMKKLLRSEVKDETLDNEMRNLLCRKVSMFFYYNHYDTRLD